MYVYVLLPKWWIFHRTNITSLFYVPLDVLCLIDVWILTMMMMMMMMIMTLFDET